MYGKREFHAISVVYWHFCDKLWLFKRRIFWLGTWSAVDSKWINAPCRTLNVFNVTLLSKLFLWCFLHIKYSILAAFVFSLRDKLKYLCLIDNIVIHSFYDTNTIKLIWKDDHWDEKSLIVLLNWWNMGIRIIFSCDEPMRNRPILCWRIVNFWSSITQFVYVIIFL